MKHPVYHLRPNKAVDRLAFIDLIRRLDKISNLKEYTYYGLGGPYLEDFRLIYELCPEIKMVCIESSEETVKRQRFHLPCNEDSLNLVHDEFSNFLAQYQADDNKSVFWLDYTCLEYSNFEEFMALLGKVAAGSMVKITLRSESKDYRRDEGPEEFRRKFETIMPDSAKDPPRTNEGFAFLVQEMLQISAQRALPGAVPLIFQPVSSFWYSDGTGMFTLTGIVCLRTEQERINKLFKGLELVNLNWGKPRKIDLPGLSTKERLEIQKILPCNINSGKTLRKTLGYLIDKDRKSTEEKLKQYAIYHRYFPYFMKAIP